MLRNDAKYEVESAIPAAAGAALAPRVVPAPTAFPNKGDPHLRQAVIMLAALEESAANDPQTQWVTSAAVEKSKARLVARDFTEQEGVDGSKTFVSPVHFDIVRLMLSQVAAHNPQMNVTTDADLHEKVSLELPERIFVAQRNRSPSFKTFVFSQPTGSRLAS